MVVRSGGVCNFIGGAQAKGSKTYPQSNKNKRKNARVACIGRGVVFVVATSQFSVLTFCTMLPKDYRLSDSDGTARVGLDCLLLLGDGREEDGEISFGQNNRPSRLPPRQ